MPIQCKGFSACIRHFSRRVRSSRAAALILAGVPGENLRCDAVVVRKGAWWGGTPPIPSSRSAAGAVQLLQAGHFCPRWIQKPERLPCWILPELCRCRRFDKSTYHFDNSSCHFGTSRFHSSQSTGYYKQIKHSVVLVVCQLLDRFTGSGCSLFALCSRVRAAALFARSLHNIECLPTV